MKKKLLLIDINWKRLKTILWRTIVMTLSTERSSGPKSGGLFRFPILFYFFLTILFLFFFCIWYCIWIWIQVSVQVARFHFYDFLGEGRGGRRRRKKNPFPMTLPLEEREESIQLNDRDGHTFHWHGPTGCPMKRSSFLWSLLPTESFFDVTIVAQSMINHNWALSQWLRIYRKWIHHTHRLFPSSSSFFFFCRLFRLFVSHCTTNTHSTEWHK